MSCLPSSELPGIFVTATGNSIFKWSSTDVDRTRLYPKIFCFLSGFLGSLRTPILASVSFGSLGHRMVIEPSTGFTQ